MKIYILICSLWIALLPLTFELGIEIYRARVLKRTDKHGLTSFVRAMFMVIGSLTYAATSHANWIEVLLLCTSLHYLIFNYAFNRWGLEGAAWYFLGNNLFDRAQKKINPVILLFFKVTFFIGSCALILA